MICIRSMPCPWITEGYRPGLLTTTIEKCHTTLVFAFVPHRDPAGSEGGFPRSLMCRTCTVSDSLLFARRVFIPHDDLYYLLSVL